MGRGKGKQNSTQWHGFKYNDNAEWKLPKQVSSCDDPNRPDQGNYMASHEYMDRKDVLEKKVDKLVEMIYQSKNMIAYTGAGISRNAGLGDYASSKNSIIKVKKVREKKRKRKRRRIEEENNDMFLFFFSFLSEENNDMFFFLFFFKATNSTECEPTLSHHVLTALQREGRLKRWVQQNHDGLPQKAGFPQHLINEIHGAWFDPSNPVVQFSGSLRTDLFNDMLEIEDSTDLCLCLGTSLSGMNADRCEETPAEKSLKGKGLGTVIVNIQKPRLDDMCALRIWGNLDEVFQLVAKKMKLLVGKNETKNDKKSSGNTDPIPAASAISGHFQKFFPNNTETDVFQIPYDNCGRRLDDKMTRKTRLDLRQGAKLFICDPNASNYGEKLVVLGTNNDGHYVLNTTKTNGKHLRRRLLGKWWIATAQNGLVPQFPVMNVVE